MPEKQKETHKATHNTDNSKHGHFQPTMEKEAQDGDGTDRAKSTSAIDGTTTETHNCEIQENEPVGGALDDG